MATKVSSVPVVHFVILNVSKTCSSWRHVPFPHRLRSLGARLGTVLLLTLSSKQAIRGLAAAVNPQLLLNIGKLQLDRIAVSQQTTAWYKRVKSNPVLNY